MGFLQSCVHAALELRTTAVVLDDMDGRRYARRLGLQPIGTLGLLLAAKQNQLIPAIQPEIERLVSMGFRASGSLIQKVLVAAGESLHA